MASREAFFATGNFNVEGSLSTFSSALRSAIAGGYRRVRAVCEMTYLLAKVPGIEHAPEFDSRRTLRSLACCLIYVCPMNLQRDIDGTWVAIQRSHPTLYADGRIHENPAYELQAR